jgi:hemerythrin superfamily protein
MPDTWIRAPKATSLLREDHEKAKGLIREIEMLGEEEADQKEALFERLRRELTVHAQIEEEIFYPAVAAAEDPEAGELVQEAREEHRAVKELLEELGALAPDDDEFEAKLAVLRDHVVEHAEEEEADIFPLFESLDRDEQEMTSETLDARRRDLKQGP